MSQRHQLYDIWEDENPPIPAAPWRAQMIDYAAQFQTKELEEKYVATIKEYQRRFGQPEHSKAENKGNIHK